MATFNSTQYGNAVATPRVPNSFADTEGRVRTMVAELPADHGNTLAQNDVLNLFTLPKGVRPLSVQINNGAFGTAVNLDIGYDGDADAIVDGHSIVAAGNEIVPVESAVALTEEKLITGTFVGGNPADAVALTVVLTYIGA